MWVEKYRPVCVDDLVLPTLVKSQLHAFADGRDVPNLLFHGPPGLGKTSAARALAQQLSRDVIEKIGGEITTNGLREVREFCTSVSVFNEFKFVIIDEADQLSKSTQGFLRKDMEEFTSLISFVLICNEPQKIARAIQSRCAVFDFTPPVAESGNMIDGLTDRACHIMQSESVMFDKGAVRSLVKHYFPDFRRALNEMQRCSSKGECRITLGSEPLEDSIDELMRLVHDREFGKVSEWAAQNGTVDSVTVLRKIYDSAVRYFQDGSRGRAANIIAEHDFRARQVTYQEINLVAALYRMREECRLKRP